MGRMGDSYGATDTWKEETAKAVFMYHDGTVWILSMGEMGT